jgi:hypothetical protein
MPRPSRPHGRALGGGLAAAALSVRGLATALVVLRGALIRTGIGALIVGAGELVYQFGRLVQGAGGVGAMRWAFWATWPARSGTA